jgi:2,4-dienoyl-CoA reductase (NADPH2)
MPDGEAGRLANVFAPVRIGALELPHRIVMGSMHMGVEAEPDAGERLAAFYRERARGGAGLIVTGGWAVSADGAVDDGYGLIDSDAGAAALERIARTSVHETEGQLALQLFHAGRYALADGPGEVVAPSAIASRVSRAEPRALGEDEVWDVVADFATAARRARELGFAAVEVMGSEGYLVDQFLSPTTNHREDSWGGDAEGRMRFGIELALAVRAAVGPEFPVIFRMTGAELMPESRPFEEVEAFAVALVAAGVDALNVGVGWHESTAPTVQGAVPAGAWMPWAVAIRNAVGDGTAVGETAGDGITGTAATSAGMAAVPVIAGNRVNRVEDAEDLLAGGADGVGGVDLISMSRPFLADPRIIEKARDGRATNVCISCNQACIDRSLSAGHVSCLVNPRAGFEREFPDPAPAQTAGAPTVKRFAVIGGGPAGLEAARALASLGAQVQLFEAALELGGQFRLARLVPGKEDYGATISYFEAELERLGVVVHLGRELSEDDADLLADLDGVVLATGVLPRRVDIPGAGASHVVDYVEAFESGLDDAERVAIVGAGGIGVDLAHTLTHAEPDDPYEAFYDAYGIGLPDRGCDFPSIAREMSTTVAGSDRENGPRVTLMRRTERVGAGIGRTTRWVWLDALKRAGVQTRTGLRYKAITLDGVEIETDDGTVETIAADRVVIAAGQERNDGLRPLLERLEVPLRVVGGAENPSELNAVRAFADGLRAAHEFAG